VLALTEETFVACMIKAWGRRHQPSRETRAGYIKVPLIALLDDVSEEESDTCSEVVVGAYRERPGPGTFANVSNPW
jgi:hypothetical protein